MTRAAVILAASLALAAPSPLSAQEAEPLRIGPGARLAVKAPARGKGPRLLRLDGVTWETPGPMLEVWLVAPDGRSEPVGLIATFGVRPGERRSFDFDVTAALRALGLRPGQSAELAFDATDGLDGGGAATLGQRAAPEGGVTVEGVRLE